MAAGEGFKTWNTGDVLSANDVNGYLMQGIWVFDDATDRTAQVTAPAEGNFSYLKDTNKLYYYTGSAWAEADTSGILPSEFTAKGDLLAGTGSGTFDNLGVGANNTVLTADSSTATGLKWATPSAGGGWTLISTTTLSSTETTISSIPTTYERLVFVIFDVTAAGSTGVFRGGPNGSYTITNGVTNNNGNTLSAEIDFIRFTGSGGAGGMDPSDGNNCWTLIVDNYTSTSAYKSFNVYGGFKIGGGVRKFCLAQGSIDTNSAITSMAFKFDTGTSFNGGTVELYGVK